jgi:hypothetical protein
MWHILWKWSETFMAVVVVVIEAINMYRTWYEVKQEPVTEPVKK